MGGSGKGQREKGLEQRFCGGLVGKVLNVELHRSPVTGM